MLSTLLALASLAPASGVELYVAKSASYGCGTVDPTGRQDVSRELGCLFALLQPGDVLHFGVLEPGGVVRPAAYEMSNTYYDSKGKLLWPPVATPPHGVSYLGHGSTLRMPATADFTKRRYAKLLFIHEPPAGVPWDALDGQPTVVRDFVLDGNRANQGNYLNPDERIECYDVRPCCEALGLEGTSCDTFATCYAASEAQPGFCYTETQSANLHLSGPAESLRPEVSDKKWARMTPSVEVSNVVSQFNTNAGMYIQHSVDAEVRSSNTDHSTNGVVVSRYFTTVHLEDHVSTEQGYGGAAIHIENQRNVCGDDQDEPCPFSCKPIYETEDHTLSVAVERGLLGLVSVGTAYGQGVSLTMKGVWAEWIFANSCRADLRVSGGRLLGPTAVEVPAFEGSLTLDEVQVHGSVLVSGTQAPALGSIDIARSDFDGDVELRLVDSPVSIDHASFAGDLILDRFAQSALLSDVEVSGTLGADSGRGGASLTLDQVTTEELEWCERNGACTHAGRSTLRMDDVVARRVRTRMRNSDIQISGGVLGHPNISGDLLSINERTGPLTLRDVRLEGVVDLYNANASGADVTFDGVTFADAHPAYVALLRADAPSYHARVSFLNNAYDLPSTAASFLRLDAPIQGDLSVTFDTPSWGDLPIGIPHLNVLHPVAAGLLEAEWEEAPGCFGAEQWSGGDNPGFVLLEREDPC